MGRPKAYVREDVVQKALAAFWKTGWEATSLQQLEGATGLNKFSLYAEFDSKRGLYLACVEAYVTTWLIPAFRVCPDPVAPADYLPLVVQHLCDHPGLGCFLLLGALEDEGRDPALTRWLDATYGDLEERLTRHWASRTRARAYVTVVQGLMTAGRLGADRGRLDDAVAGCIDLFR